MPGCGFCADTCQDATCLYFPGSGSVHNFIAAKVLGGVVTLTGLRARRLPQVRRRRGCQAHWREWPCADKFTPGPSAVRLNSQHGRPRGWRVCAMKWRSSSRQKRYAFIRIVRVVSF